MCRWQCNVCVSSVWYPDVLIFTVTEKLFLIIYASNSGAPALGAQELPTLPTPLLRHCCCSWLWWWKSPFSTHRTWRNATWSQLLQSTSNASFVLTLYARLCVRQRATDWQWWQTTHSQRKHLCMPLFLPIFDAISISWWLFLGDHT